MVFDNSSLNQPPSHCLTFANGRLVLPIGSRALFIGARSPRFNDWMKSSVEDTRVAKTIDKAVVAQAREFVWAENDHQKTFVEKYIGAAPDRVLISKQTRAQSLMVARGRSEDKAE
jgi:hypothetical protein